MLSFIPPMLPTLVDEPPAGDAWLHEIKHDGYRTELILHRSGSRAFTRNGHDWSDRYALVLKEAERLASDAILDGEVMIQDEEGRSDFAGLKATIANTPDRLIFYAFDLLWLDGRDLRAEPLLERRTKLAQVVGSHNPSARIQFSEAVVGGGPEFFDIACAAELEGIVSKKLNSSYRSGRTRSWLKIKAFVEDEFVVIGWEPPARGPAVALLARETDQGLEYAGGAFVTLSDDERERFWRSMDALAVTTPAVNTGKLRSALWVSPQLRVRAKHLRCAGMLRHATLCGIVNGTG